MLQAQLAQSKSLNAALLKSHKNVESYLFTPQQAAHHDLDSLYALATNGLQFLASSQSLSPHLRKRSKEFKDTHADLRSILNNSPLFVSSARVMRDKTSLTPEENQVLDKEIEQVLYAISPWLMEQAAGGILEWLVRRYRVHEFNVDTLLAVFLPYHTTQHFIKLVSILHIPQSSPYHSLLAPHRKSLTALPLASLTAAMDTNSLFANKIFSILPDHVKHGAEHRAVVGWSLGVGMHFIESISGRKGNEAALATLLSNLSKASSGTRDADTAGACILLFTQLASHIALTSSTVAAILNSLVGMKASVPPAHITMSASLTLSKQSLQELTDPFIHFIVDLAKNQDILNESAKFLVNPALLHLVADALCKFISSDQSEEEEDRKDTDKAYHLLDHLIRTSHLTIDGATTVGQALLHRYIALTESTTFNLRILALLRTLCLLHPDQLRAAVQAVRQNQSDVSDVLEQLMINITMPTNVQEGTEDNIKFGILLASSAEPSLRARGIRAFLMHQYVDAMDLEIEGGIASVRQLLLARLEDSNTEVLQALYASPVNLIGLVGYEEVMKALESVLRKADLTVDVLSSHVSFLLQATQDEDKHSARVGIILFPYLLLTKGGFKRSKAVWEALQENNQFEDEMLKNTASLFVEVDWKTLKGDVDAMGGLNEHIVDLLAANIAGMPQYEQTISFLVHLTRDFTPSTSKTLSLLVIHAILNRVQGQRKLELGLSIISALTNTGLTALEGSEGKSVTSGSEKIDFHRVVSKPEHQSTYAKLYATILLLLPTITHSTASAEPIDWFSQSNSNEANYIYFTRMLYTLLNSISNIFTHSLRALFLTLRESSLLLLASIWADRSATSVIRASALKHAQAFIRALISEKGRIDRDLQLIFPILLASSWETDQEIRKEACVCISLMASAKNDGKAPEVYGLKCLPKSIIDEIKFLEWRDFVDYASAVASNTDAIEMDAGALVALQENLLMVTSQSSGKESRFKKRVLSYLLSHARAWNNVDIRLPLLISMSTIPDPGKLQFVTPLIQELASEGAVELLKKLDSSQQEIYVNTLLSSLNYVEELPSGPLLTALFELVQRSGDAPETQTLLRGLPAVMEIVLRLMNSSQKLQLCHLLTSLIRKPSQSAHLKLLASTMDDEQTLITLLKELRPPPSDEQPTKRARLETDTLPLVKLATVCQALCISSSRRSTTVLRSMLDSLDATLDSRGMEHTETAHIQQSIMTALAHMAQFVSSEEGGIQLRIDVLVNLIKDSENPQIIHQALLLVASLAQWSSDSLLHHLMPILLSTGGYISPRDDLYSARVAEKTVDSVIPLLTSHLRSNYSSKASLQMAARPYLLIFTDASTTIPSHRRTSFFLHLLSILGPADFLNPICLLLLDAADINTKTLSEKMELAVNVTQAQSLTTRLAALSDLLEDIVAELSPPQSTELSLLSSLRTGSVDSEENWNRIHRLFHYINQVLERSRSAVKVEKDEYPQRILGALVRLMAITETLHQKEGPRLLQQNLSSALTNASRLVPPSTVLYTCLQLLRCNDAALQIELFSLLAARLSEVTHDARTKMSNDMVLMIRIIKETLVTASTSKLSIASLTALQAIAKSFRSAELTALAETLPAVTSNIPDPSTARIAMDTLNELCGSLGPRIIPHLSHVIQTTCSLLRSSSVSDGLVVTTTHLLRHLLDVASSFWTVSDAESALLVYVKELSKRKGQAEQHLKSFGKSISKRISTNVFVDAFTKIWKVIREEDNRTQRDIAFVVLRHGIKAAGRVEIAQESRALLVVFLEAWDNELITKDEDAAIKAFVELVVKLNDSSFKPLYRKLFDWAWSIDEDSKTRPRTGRAIAYCEAMGAILSLLKGLMTPYMAPLVGRAAEIADLWAQSPEDFEDFELWLRILTLIKQSIEVDDGAFWRDEFVRILVPVLVRQVPIAANPQKPWMADSLGDTLGALGSVSDTHLKTLNIDLLMHTRSEEARIQICALRCLSRVWLVDGHKLAGWKRETMPFLHECAEDENEDVVHEARSLKAILDKF